MKYYYIQPKDENSYSKRWHVDEDGLEHIKDHYENYTRKTELTIDRWEEFKYKEIDEIYFDFGGSMHGEMPNAEVKIDGIRFGCPCSHYVDLISFIASKNKPVQVYNIWVRSYCFNIETRSKIVAAFAAGTHQFDKDLARFNLKIYGED